MKKIFAILSVCFVFALTSCSFTENKTLEFSFNQTKQWFLFREMQIVFSSMFTS